MYPLIFAAETAITAPVGDDLLTLSLIILGVAMLIAAVATAIVTPGRERD